MQKVLAVYDVWNIDQEDVLLLNSLHFSVERISVSKFAKKKESDYDVLILTKDSFAELRALLKDDFNSRVIESDTIVISSTEIMDLECASKGCRAKVITTPYREEEIVEAVENIIHIKQAKHAKENFEKMVLEEAERFKPIIREQFLRDYILGIGDTEEIFNIYCKTFCVEYTQETRMILFQPEHELEFEDSFFLRNIIEGYIGNANIMLSTSIKDNILIVTTLVDEERIKQLLQKLVRVIKKYYQYKVSMVYSVVCSICDTPQMYEHLEKCIEYCFYSKDNSSIICAGEIHLNQHKQNIETNYGNIERAVKGGDIDKTEILIKDFFVGIERAKFSPSVAKTYCLELYVCIIRCCEVETIDKYMKGIVELQGLKTLTDIREYVLGVAKEVALSNRPKFSSAYSSLINETIGIIDNNLGNENLSLRWIAGTVLYTNVDYLGKMFKKEVGENFSYYVMKKRMEVAKDLILNGRQDKIYEVAEKVGYGSNSQYFSQVFKKYTGISPLEYKEFSKLKSAEKI